MSAHRRKSMASLGLIGGILGLVMGVIALVAGGIGAVFDIHGSFELFSNSWVALLLSFIGVVGAGITRKDAIVGGVLMLVSGIVGIATIGGFFIIPFLILLIAALVALIDQFA